MKGERMRKAIVIVMLLCGGCATAKPANEKIVRGATMTAFGAPFVIGGALSGTFVAISAVNLQAVTSSACVGEIKTKACQAATVGSKSTQETYAIVGAAAVAEVAIGGILIWLGTSALDEGVSDLATREESAKHSDLAAERAADALRTESMERAREIQRKKKQADCKPGWDCPDDKPPSEEAAPERAVVTPGSDF